MDIALHPDTGDIDLDNGDAYVVEETEAIAQFLTQRLRLFITEWFLDESEGIPFIDKVFVKNPKAVEVDTIFKQAILSTPGIVELLTFSVGLDKTTRRLQLNFIARAKTGLIEFNNTISPGG